MTNIRLSTRFRKGAVLESVSIEDLDRISVALFAGHGASAPSEVTISDLIPYVEWNWLRRSGHHLPSPAATLALGEAQQAIAQRLRAWVDDSMHPSVGFARIHRGHADTENPSWLSFLLSLGRAARHSGLNKSLSDQLTGAVKEMEDNVHWHSKLPSTGLVAFLSHESRFEIVVADAGRGVLASLRDAPEFAALTDDGAALEAAIGTGNSRFGRESGRGWGFHDLIVGLANFGLTVRLRSGDHVLELSSPTADNLVSHRAQRARSVGFIVSIRATA